MYIPGVTEVLDTVTNIAADFSEDVKNYEENIALMKKADAVADAAERMLGYFDNASKLYRAMTSINDAIAMIDSGSIWSGDSANQYRSKLKDIYNKLKNILNKYSDNLKSIENQYREDANIYMNEANKYVNEMNELELITTAYRGKYK